MGRLLRLISHLPPEAAYRRATDQHWTDDLELGALQVELLHALLVGLARLGGSRKVIKPLRLPRPGEPAPQRGRRMSFLDLIGEGADGGQVG